MLNSKQHMGAPDPFPALAHCEALLLLRKCLGQESVRWEHPFDTALVRFPSVDGRTRLRRFTWQQAKYLAARPDTCHSIMTGKYPKDWPLTELAMRRLNPYRAKEFPFQSGRRF